MTNKRPFDKENMTKIPFGDLIELINQKCDYKFAIIDNEVDEELMSLAKKEGIDLTGYKHVIETSGARHSETRHGRRSKDRNPLTLEDYLLIPYIIKYRDKVEFSDKKTRLHGLKTFVYRKTIGNLYVYVEEIRIGRKKSLAFQTLYKRHIKKPPNRRLCFVIAGGVVSLARPSRLDNPFVFHSVFRDQLLAKLQIFHKTRPFFRKND